MEPGCMSMDARPFRCVPMGNDAESATGVIPGERSEGRGSTNLHDALRCPPLRSGGVTLCSEALLCHEV